MSEQLRESLSAVIDGEADTFEVRRVIDECAKDDELARAWSRYHLIGSIIRGEHSDRTSRMPDAIWAAIDADMGDESDPSLPAAGRRPVGWRRRVLQSAAGVAVAATVALAVVVGFESDDSGPGSAVDLVVANPVEQTPVAPGTADVQRANAYYLHHVRAAAINSQAGMLPFTRAVTGSYEQE